MLKNNWKVHIFFFKWSHGSSKTFLQGQVIIGYAILSLFVRVYSKGAVFAVVFTFLCLCLFLFFQLFLFKLLWRRVYSEEQPGDAATALFIKQLSEEDAGQYRWFFSSLKKIRKVKVRNKTICGRKMQANTGGSFLLPNQRKKEKNYINRRRKEQISEEDTIGLEDQVQAVHFF